MVTPVVAAGGERVEVGPQHLAQVGEVGRRVLLHRVGGVLVPLDGGDGAEPGLLDAEVETSGAGEQRDGGSAHRAILARSAAAVAHSGRERERVSWSSVRYRSLRERSSS